jgi:hypothetical protein
MEERVVELLVVVVVPRGLERVVGTGRRNGSSKRVVEKSCRRRSKAGMGRRGNSNSVVDVGT